MSYLVCPYERHKNSPITDICIKIDCLDKRYVCLACKFDKHKEHEEKHFFELCPLKIQYLYYEVLDTLTNYRNGLFQIENVDFLIFIYQQTSKEELSLERLHELAQQIAIIKSEQHKQLVQMIKNVVVPIDNIGKQINYTVKQFESQNGQVFKQVKEHFCERQENEKQKISLLVQQIQSLKQNSEQCTRSIQKRSLEFENQQRQILSIQEELKLEKIKSQAKDNEIEKLKKNNSQLQLQISESQQLTSNKALANQIKQDINSMQISKIKEFTKFSKQEQDLEKEKIRSCQALNELNEEKISHQKTIIQKEQLEKSVHNFEQQSNELNIQIEKQSQEIKSLQLKVIELQNQKVKDEKIQHLTLLNEQLSKEIEGIKKEVEITNQNYKTQIDILNTSLEQEKWKVQSLNEQISSLNQEQKQLTKNFEQYAQSLKEKDAELGNYQNQILTISEQLNQLIQENQNLSIKLGLSQSQYEETNDMNKKVIDDIHKKSKEMVETLQEELSKQTYQNHSKEKEIEQLKKMKQQLQLELQESQFYKQRYEEQKQQNDEATNSIKGLQEKNVDYVKEIEKQNLEVQNLKHKIKEKDQKFENFKTELDGIMQIFVLFNKQIVQEGKLKRQFEEESGTIECEFQQTQGAQTNNIEEQAQKIKTLQPKLLQQENQNAIKLLNQKENYDQILNLNQSIFQLLKEKEDSLKETLIEATNQNLESYNELECEKIQSQSKLLKQLQNDKQLLSKTLEEKELDLVNCQSKLSKSDQENKQLSRRLKEAQIAQICLENVNKEQGRLIGDKEAKLSEQILQIEKLQSDSSSLEEYKRYNEKLNSQYLEQIQSNQKLACQFQQQKRYNEQLGFQFQEQKQYSQKLNCSQQELQSKYEYHLNVIKNLNYQIYVSDQEVQRQKQQLDQYQKQLYKQQVDTMILNETKIKQEKELNMKEGTIMKLNELLDNLKGKLYKAKELLKQLKSFLEVFPKPQILQQPQNNTNGQIDKDKKENLNEKIFKEEDRLIRYDSNEVESYNLEKRQIIQRICGLLEIIEKE